MAKEKVEVLDVQLGETPIEEAEPLNVQTAAPKFRVEWRPDEKGMVDAIIDAANIEIHRMFAEAFQVEYNFLSKVRTPETDDYGNALKTPDGGTVWRKNPDGTVYEDWSRITLSDLDQFILNASSWAFFGAQDSTDVWAQAVMAKLMLDEEYDARYASFIDGTIADKQARASRMTQDSRYFAAYLAILQRKAKEVVDRLDTTVRRAENIRNQRTWELRMKLPK